MVSCHIDIDPRPAPRPRVGRSGQVYMPNEYKEYVEEIRKQANPYFLNYSSHCPAALYINFSRNVPIKQKRYGDIDNLIKGVMDALIGYAYFDDAQIVSVTANKFKGDSPGIDIIIDYLEE